MYLTILYFRILSISLFFNVEMTEKKAVGSSYTKLYYLSGQVWDESLVKDSQTRHDNPYTRSFSLHHLFLDYRSASPDGQT